MFSDYKGKGITPVSGVIEAGANIGKMYQQGLMSMGESIGAGLKKYGENQQQDEFLTAKGAGIAENLKFMQQNINDIPELAPFAERFNPLMKKFGNFGGMSRNQKAGFIAEAEAFQAQIAPNLSIYKEGLVAKTQQGVQSALSQKVSIPTSVGGKPLEAIPYLPAKTPEENFALNKKAFEVQAEAQGLTEFDVNSAISKLGRQWEHNFANDPNLAKTDPKFRDTILKGLSDWRNLSANTATDAETGVTDYGKEASAYAGVTTSASSIMRGENLSKPAKVFLEKFSQEELTYRKREAQSSISYLTEQLKTASPQERVGIQRDIDTENETLAEVDEAIGSGLAKPAKQFEAEADAKIDAKLAKVKPVTAQEKFEDAKKKLQDEIDSTTIELFKAKEKNKNASGVHLLPKGRFNPLRPILGDDGVFNPEYVANDKLDSLTKKRDNLKVSDFQDDDPTVNILKTKDTVDAQIKAEEAKLAELLIEQKKNTSFFTKGGSPAEATVGKIQGLLKDFAANRLERQTDPSTPIIQNLKGVLPDYVTGMLTLAGETGMFDPRTQAQKDLAKAGISAALDKKFPNAPLPDRIKSVKDRLDTLKNISTEAQKAVKAVETANEPEKPADTYDQPFDYKTKIQEGVIAGTRDETYGEEKERVRQWFVDNNKGIIPSSLDAVYKSIRPETDVKFMPAPDGGQVMITSKGAQYIPPVERKQMTDEQRSDVTLFNYGTPDASGTRIIPEERAKGSGIKLAGFAKGGKESAKEFKKLHDDTVQTRIIIPKLLAMYKQDKLGRTLIPSEMWGEAESLLAKLKAAIRVETVGTGPVALPEHQMILERIGDPRKFFQFDTVGKSKLNSIMNSMQDSLKNNSAGIQVTFAPTAGDVKGLEQQARIEANR